MQDSIQTRKIPTKSLIIMFILIILGIGTFFITKSGKEAKAIKILHKLGYQQIINVKVFGVTKVEDKNTRVQGFRYFVTFENKQKNQLCRGFILQDFKRKVDQDISCKDKK